MKSLQDQLTFDILLVEDNRGDVFLVREALAEAGFSHDLHVAQDGKEALDYLHARLAGGQALPDLAILDLNLPGKNGRQVMAELQDDPLLASVPVAILTTSGFESGIGREFPHLRSTFAAKTANFAELVAIVSRFRDFALKSA